MRLSNKIVLFIALIGLIALSICIYSNFYKTGREHDFGNYFPRFLILCNSTSEIENQLHEAPGYFEKQEVKTTNAQFLLYRTIPIRGFLINGIYCYEQVESQPSKEKYWTLRGYFTINAGPRVNQTHQAAVIDYIPDGDSVKIRMDGVDLYSIKSLSVFSNTFVISQTSTP